jgi:flagellin-specific chaperone FliS
MTAEEITNYIERIKDEVKATEAGMAQDDMMRAQLGVDRAIMILEDCEAQLRAEGDHYHG